MSETKHTPEPWSAPGISGGTQYDIQTDKAHIARVSHIPTVGGDSEAAANARRIVACVNACAGIPTEALERGVVRELLEACDEAVSQLDSLAKAHDSDYSRPDASLIEQLRAAVLKASLQTV